MDATFTDRQRRELEYHRVHAAQHRNVKPLDFRCLTGERRWWNAHWEMYALVRNLPEVRRRVLVVGCGFGDDAVRLAKLGGEVHGFDLSPDCLAIANELAAVNEVHVNFCECPAEALPYPDRHFDLIVMRDILHHVDIPATLKELRRVSAKGAVWAVNEIYSHTWTDRVRHSRPVERVLYPTLRSFVYRGEKPYITADERKMTEGDIAAVKSFLRVTSESYFNAIVTRVLPDKWPAANKADRAFLRAVGPVGRYLAGRVLIAGRL